MDRCLSSIILSPLKSNVKMSPHETGDIHVESEGTGASERDQHLHPRRLGVCQRRMFSISNASSGTLHFRAESVMSDPGARQIIEQPLGDPSAAALGKSLRRST